ncbi:hypothetical protein QBZ16_001471 [Prototheca wickerhamii]|uniref:Ribosomal RNA methyltransferase FtsJ domain-containing protein n=1 Tax=Prototheca wickerhamii TaxID=3111 RepID=A0AAD9IET5_PROWI|nr:hypothetical protein QBZ16_001471 [Prototheca wickerhamii]
MVSPTLAEPGMPLAKSVPDVYIQFQSQTHAWRCVMLHRTGKFFPDGAGLTAEEVGPHTDHAGPATVKLHHVTLARPAFEAWLQGCVIEWAIMRVYWARDMSASKEALVDRLINVYGPPKGVTRLQCYPRSLEGWLGEQLPLTWELHPVTFTHTLHVVETEHGYAFELAPTAALFRSTAWTPARLDGLCKATAKLAEALAWARHAPGGGGAAIDLGSAPGGWSTVLSRYVDRVVAVDPAAMSPEALALPNLVHIRKKVEDALPDVRRALGGAGADLLVCDMNKHPLAMIAMVKPLMPLLKPGGRLILTLKFFSRSRGKAWDPHACPELEAFEDIQVLWFLANTAHERTCMAVKKL